MAATYIQLDLKIQPIDVGREITLAVLSELGFESFVETQVGLEAYIQEEDWQAENGLDISWSLTSIPPENWNAVWESDFQPIVIENKCAVRANFHDPIDVPYELLITPKMSFGTGHHQTTYMMLNYLLQYPPKDHTLLDMGCGTGVLAILAEKLGAIDLDAIDLEPWCYENTVENIKMNNCQHIVAAQGDSNRIPDKIYDTILANINMNVLLLDIPLFSKRLKDNGSLFLSGFYTQDIPAIEAKANQNGLRLLEFKQKDNWVSAHFSKSNG